MPNCCSTGCGSGCDNTSELLKIPFEIFALSPEKFRPKLYTRKQFDMLSKLGHKLYMDNIVTFNSMCRDAERLDLLINEDAPWADEKA
jgi:hypothetical protein